MRTFIAVFAAVAITAGLSLGGAALYLGTESDEPAAQSQAAWPTATPHLDQCADVFKPGKVIDPKRAESGCLDPRGGIQVVGSFGCEDGRQLWQVDAATGAVAGFGFSGEKYRASKEAARDPAYSRAYDSCVG